MWPDCDPRPSIRATTLPVKPSGYVAPEDGLLLSARSQQEVRYGFFDFVQNHLRIRGSFRQRVAAWGQHLDRKTPSWISHPFERVQEGDRRPSVIVVKELYAVSPKTLNCWDVFPLDRFLCPVKLPPVVGVQFLP